MTFWIARPDFRRPIRARQVREHDEKDRGRINELLRSGDLRGKKKRRISQMFN